jgi:hypothetical protein
MIESMRSKLIRPWKANSSSKLNSKVIKDADSFDARTFWESLIIPVENQGECGDSYLLSVFESASDRLNIIRGSTVGLSIEDLIYCDPNNEYGCDGGYPKEPYDYILKTGIAFESCIPNTSKTCPPTCADGSDIIRTKATSVDLVDHTDMETELSTNGPYTVAYDVYSDFLVTHPGYINIPMVL